MLDALHSETLPNGLFAELIALIGLAVKVCFF